MSEGATTGPRVRLPFVFGEPIRTERLLLRPFQAGDLDALFSYRSREDVARYLYWEAQTIDQVRKSLEAKIAAIAIREEGDFLALAAVSISTGKVIGDVNLGFASREHALGEIGYIVHPDHHGRGYATEAAEPLLRIAFEELGLHRVFASVEARNAASARVLEKIGMRNEAHLVENEFVRGEWQSGLVYAILEREWHAEGDP
jgi:RimJ/RimL family protein N-acetyltransferase